MWESQKSQDRWSDGRVILRLAARFGGGGLDSAHAEGFAKQAEISTVLYADGRSEVMRKCVQYVAFGADVTIEDGSRRRQFPADLKSFHRLQ